MTTSPQEQIVVDMFAALDHLQPEPFFEFFSDDVTIVDEIGKKWLRGKAEAVATWTPILAAMQSCKSKLYDFHVDDAGDISIVTCMLDQTYVYEGQSIALTAPTTCLTRKDNRGWKIILVHSIPFAEN
jgi:ketosteroid isomerase-like protein